MLLSHKFDNKNIKNITNKNIGIIKEDDDNNFLLGNEISSSDLVNSD